MKKINLEILEKKIVFIFFQNPKKTFNSKQLKAFIGFKINESDFFKIMNSICRENYIINLGRGKYKFDSRRKYFTGKIVNKKRGLIDLETSTEFKITKREKPGLFDDDIVYYWIDRRNKIRIASLKIRELKKYVGIVKKEGPINLLKNTGLDVDVIIKGKCEENDMVTAHVTDWKYTLPEGKVLKVIGNKDDANTQIHAILEEFNLPYYFSKKLIEEANKQSGKIVTEGNRKDLRETLTFTIDPADAKDFDDAISFKYKKNGNIEAGVHIADVTHFLKEGSALDEEAKKRATSVYLSDRVVPMLPERLSNNLCSLNPKEDKLAFSVIVEFDKKNNVKSVDFTKSIINSNERMSYEEALYLLTNGKAHIPKEISVYGKERKISDEVKDALYTLNNIAIHLKKERKKSGSIFFNKEEVRFTTNDEGEPIDFKIKKQSQANFLIEEFMLLANVLVAKKIKEHKGTAVFRVHDYPDENKIIELERFVKNLGYNIRLSDTQNINDSINNLLITIQDSEEKNVIDMMIIRAMSKAKYSTNNIGHFGLGFEYYTHFTSPIRRYPDVMVHRLLNNILSIKSAKKVNHESMCIYCSKMEELATKAERASIKLMQVKYMSKRINQKFVAVVSGMNERGVFVEIKENKCEGLVRMKDIPNDFFTYDNKKTRVVGQHTHEEYSLGDEVLIKVIKTDIDKKHIDFKILERNQ